MIIVIKDRCVRQFVVCTCMSHAKVNYQSVLVIQQSSRDKISQNRETCKMRMTAKIAKVNIQMYKLIPNKNNEKQLNLQFNK